MARHRILPGLPATGPWPEQFSVSGRGTHREGFVVEFHPGSTRSWIGNFERGGTDFDTVLLHPDGVSLVVIAGGTGYVIDPDQRLLRFVLQGQIYSVIATSQPTLLIVSDGLVLEAVGANGSAWKSRRISWDGIWDLQVVGERLHGLSYDALKDCEVPFSVDILSGRAEGGGYS